MTTRTIGASADSGPIQVVSGFAAARRDGKAAMACVSFKNAGSVAATEIVFDFSLADRNGDDVATLHLDRRGTFSPGVGIYGFATLAAWQSGGNRDYRDNCTSVRSDMAALPIIKAQYATYKVNRVAYADGSVWPP